MTGIELPRLAAAGATLAAYTWVCLRAWRRQRPASASPTATGAAEAANSVVLVAYASQSGCAHELAEETAEALRNGGVTAQLLPLAELSSARLQAGTPVLFLVSTCGEGDAPDNAARFVEQCMCHPLPLDGVQYGLLALGDRRYRHYCGFGRRLDAWLQDNGAQALFPRVELDQANADSLQQWRHQVANVAGLAELPEAAQPAPGFWRLRARHRLNPGSVGHAVFQVELEAVAGADREAPRRPTPDWQAGDLLQLYLPGQDEAPRAYSIASLPGDGAVQLLVRAIAGPDGQPGRMSSLLCDTAQPGTVLRGRLRAHHNFRIGDNHDRPLILIGNGTGLAGLMAHLRQRAAQGDGRNWLVFGERHAAHDDFCGEELDALMQADLLARCDRVFSRDAPAGEYVQHRLQRAADSLREWVAGGAAIYVCGNAVGMGPAVHQTLIDALGADTVRQLTDSGRYRRDIY